MTAVVLVPWLRAATRPPALRTTARRGRSGLARRGGRPRGERRADREDIGIADGEARDRLRLACRSACPAADATVDNLRARANCSGVGARLGAPVARRRHQLSARAWVRSLIGRGLTRRSTRSSTLGAREGRGRALEASDRALQGGHAAWPRGPGGWRRREDLHTASKHSEATKKQSASLFGSDSWNLA